ncbi:zinc finger protein 616-like [Limanda limanda]|uniref:zinc finger protein 616-like n=1 Tax=Limanda limanda TaxID=27771 RepID=UPI0029C8C97B|nr:zinc finger protein 616-like [Limanda limanda]
MWTDRSSGDMMSKSEILRDIITEKLSTAAREILAVMERTVSGFEEEAAGFRLEVEQQRRQMEALLQPRVRLERRALNPDVDRHDVVVINEEEEEEEEEEEHTQQPDVEDSGGLGILWYDGDDDDDDECKDEEEHMKPTTSYRKKREDAQDPDYQIPSRTFTPRVQSGRRKPGRPRILDTQNHVDLKIRILEDSHTDVLTQNVFQTCPLQELQCPRGLQETDFLRLLRSSFPQLAADQPFDVFTTDRSRKLQRLRVRTLTPEEIQRSIGSTGAGKSSLYIRPKSGDDPLLGTGDLHPLQRQDATRDSASGSVTPTADQTEMHESSSSPRGQPEKRRRGRPRLSDSSDHHSLRICLVEDSPSGVLSKSVLMKSSVQHLKCPRGLQEPDFLDLLKSTFPQLTGDNNMFEVFKSDRSRKLQRLKVRTLTPEDICRSLKATGIERTLIYIKQKTKEEEEEKEEEDLQLLPRKVEATDDSQSPVATVMNRGEAGSGSSSSASQHNVEPEEAAESEVASDEEKDDDTDDWKPDVEPQKPERRRRRPKPYVVERSKTPCRVCGVWYKVLGSLIKHAWSHVDESPGACGVCGERPESVEELKKHLRNQHQTHACSHCGKSFSTVTGLSIHTTLHTGNRPFKCEDCGKTFAHRSSLSAHRWVHVADKPHKCDICPKAFGLMAQLKAHRKTHSGRDKYQCNVCGKLICDLRSLSRHKATHSGERRYGCEVCGKRFKLPFALKSHEKIHTVRERRYLCDICCKTFLSNCALTMHMRTHSGERPFLCGVCSKGFISNGQLKAHTRVHTGEAPYGCSQCGRFFKSRTHLTNHIRSHSGIKLFVCAVCGKACSRQEHLTVHMRTHNGERPYKCSLCDKAFTQSHCLKSHMKSHSAEEKSSLSPST